MLNFTNLLLTVIICHTILMLMMLIEVEAMKHIHAAPQGTGHHQSVSIAASPWKRMRFLNPQRISTQQKNRVSIQKQTNFPHLELSTISGSELTPAQHRGHLLTVKAMNGNGDGSDGHAYFSSDDEEDNLSEDENDDQISKNLMAHLVEKLRERFAERHSDANGIWRRSHQQLVADERNIELVARWLASLPAPNEHKMFFEEGLMLVNILHEVDTIALQAMFLCLVEDLLERQAERWKVNGDPETVIYRPELLLKHFKYKELENNMSILLVHANPRHKSKRLLRYGFGNMTAADSFLQQLKLRGEDVFDVQMRIEWAKWLIDRAMIVRMKFKKFFNFPKPDVQQFEEFPTETLAECVGDKGGIGPKTGGVI